MRYRICCAQERVGCLKLWLADGSAHHVGALLCLSARRAQHVSTKLILKPRGAQHVDPKIFPSIPKICPSTSQTHFDFQVSSVANFRNIF